MHIAYVYFMGTHNRVLLNEMWICGCVGDVGDWNATEESTSILDCSYFI